MKLFNVIVTIVFALAVFTACGESSGNDTATVAPTEVVAQPTEAPTATPEPAATDTPAPVATTAAVTTSAESTFASGGLGQDEAWWETNHGPGADDVLGKKYGNYIVQFTDGKASSIERQWPPTQAVTPEEALAEGQQFAPVDASQIETYSPAGRPETTVNLFLSPSLAERFEAADFIGGQPGTFTIQYNIVEGQVTRMIVALGNNP